MSDSSNWSPPYKSTKVAELQCSKCENYDCVRVCEEARYTDGEVYEAYCADCHASLEVIATVATSFDVVDATEEEDM